jgi:hypothetical protein
MAVVGIGLGAAIRRPDSFTKLHLRMNGEGNIFRDLTSKSITVSGDVSQKKISSMYNGSSAWFNGGFLKITSVSDLSTATTQDHCFETSLMFTSIASAQCIFAISSPDLNNAIRVVWRGTTYNQMSLVCDQNGNQYSHYFSFTPSISIRYDIKLYRLSGRYYLYINKDGYGTWDDMHYPLVISKILIGINNDESSLLFNGYLSEVVYSQVSRSEDHISTRRK